MENPRQQPPRLPNLTQLNSNRTTLKSRSILTFPVSNGFLWQLSELWKTLGESRGIVWQELLNWALGEHGLCSVLGN